MYDIWAGKKECDSEHEHAMAKDVSINNLKDQAVSIDIRRKAFGDR